jgi:hypothetical protein
MTGWPGDFLRKEEGPEESADGGEVAGDLRTELVRGVRETLRKKRRSRRGRERTSSPKVGRGSKLIAVDQIRDE